MEGLKDSEKFKHIEGFAKAHKKAALRFCRKNNIDPQFIHAYTEDSINISYEYKGSVFLTAKLEYIPKVKLRFKPIK